ncbi:visceral mesodermal armadillo-repeats [Cotesia typhae]|uniref:visceral mesodermal armadillo-repeats n=1 Tax=Cotesia typhae TaxID=2053667 RepID=UPI003D691FE7
MEEKPNNDIDKLVEQLTEVVKLQDDKAHNENDIIKILDSFLEVEDNFTEDVEDTTTGEVEDKISEEVENQTSEEGDEDFKIDGVFLRLLSHESDAVVAKTAKTIAEIAQTDNGRTNCTDSNLVKGLMDLLQRDNIEIITQTSRALGNICYENVRGTKMVQDNDGLKYILKVLERAVSLGDAEGASFLRHVIVGFLLNFLVGQNTLQQEALDQGFISIACNILEIDGPNNAKSAMHVLLTLELLTETGLMFLNERLTKVLVNLLDDEEAIEHSILCLELIQVQAEHESAKTLLAKAGACELLIQLIEKHVPKCVDEDTRSVLKMACNLIVLILTGDESMNVLYSNSEGSVYKKLDEWLDPDYDEDLQIAAVLSMGNFARTETHCKLMVAQGVHKRLFKLLVKNSSSESDIRLQHALLSAVRNLVIAPSNKPILLSHDLIDVVYPMLDIQTFPVVFKLLGTLRIVIDGQSETATILGKREDFLKKVIDWCNIEEHPGVQGEANRLIAWIIINSRDKDVVSLVIKHGAIKYLVRMMGSLHPLMQNEALLSLTITTAMFLKDCEEKLVEAEVDKALKKFFEESTSSLAIPIVENALSFAIKIIKSDVLKKHLKNAQFLDTLEKAKSSGIWMNSLEDKTEKLLRLLSV